jgi:L-ribulokinase
VPVRRLILGGRAPQKNDVISRVYANALGKPVLVPRGEATGLGAAIFAFLAAGTFQTVEDAQDALCLSYRTVEPDPVAVKSYDRLYALYKRLYFGFGHRAAAALGADNILPTLRRVAAESVNREA